MLIFAIVEPINPKSLMLTYANVQWKAWYLFRTRVRKHPAAAGEVTWQHTTATSSSTILRNSSCLTRSIRKWQALWRRRGLDWLVDSRGKLQQQEASIILPYPKPAVCKQPRVIVGCMMAKAAVEDLLQVVSVSGLCITGILQAIWHLLNGILDGNMVIIDKLRNVRDEIQAHNLSQRNRRRCSGFGSNPPPYLHLFLCR